MQPWCKRPGMTLTWHLCELDLTYYPKYFLFGVNEVLHCVDMESVWQNNRVAIYYLCVVPVTSSSISKSSSSYLVRYQKVGELLLLYLITMTNLSPGKMIFHRHSISTVLSGNVLWGKAGRNANPPTQDSNIHAYITLVGLAAFYIGEDHCGTITLCSLVKRIAEHADRNHCYISNCLVWPALCFQFTAACCTTYLIMALC